MHLIRTPSPVPGPEGNGIDAFDRELDYLYSTLQRLGAPPADIDDLLQEIFLVIHRHWPTLDGARPLRPWLFGVAFRVVRSHRLRRGSESPWLRLDADDAVEHRDRQLQDHESLAILWVALEYIPSVRRAVVVKHDLEGLEIADIARQLSMSWFGVYARLYKGRKELATTVRRLLREGVPRT